jgi:hypothetical protein
MKPVRCIYYTKQNRQCNNNSIAKKSYCRQHTPNKNDRTTQKRIFRLADALSHLSESKFVIDQHSIHCRMKKVQVNEVVVDWLDNKTHWLEKLSSFKDIRSLKVYTESIDSIDVEHSLITDVSLDDLLTPQLINLEIVFNGSDLFREPITQENILQRLVCWSDCMSNLFLNKLSHSAFLHMTSLELWFGEEAECDKQCLKELLDMIPINMPQLVALGIKNCYVIDSLIETIFGHETTQEQLYMIDMGEGLLSTFGARQMIETMKNSKYKNLTMVRYETEFIDDEDVVEELRLTSLNQPFRPQTNNSCHE